MGKLGQVGTRQQIRKMGEKAKRIRKENKNSVVRDKKEEKEEKVGSRIHQRLLAN